MINGAQEEDFSDVWGQGQASRRGNSTQTLKSPLSCRPSRSWSNPALGSRSESGLVHPGLCRRSVGVLRSGSHRRLFGA